MLILIAFCLTPASLTSSFGSASAYSNRLETLVDKAQEYERKWKPQRCIKICDQIIATAPDMVRAYAVKARALIDLKQMDEANAVLQTALKIKGNQSSTYLSLGKWYEAKGDNAAAMKAYEQAVALNKRDIEALHDLANLCEKTRQIARARQTYDAMVAVNSAVIEGYALRGGFMQRQGKIAEALSDYSAVLSRTPKNSAVRSKRAALYFQQKNYKQALDDYAFLSNQNPYDGDALVAAAEVHLALKQYKEGIADCNRAIELDGDDGRAFYFRAMNNQGIGQKASADADLKKAAGLGYKAGAPKFKSLVD